MGRKILNSIGLVLLFSLQAGTNNISSSTRRQLVNSNHLLIESPQKSIERDPLYESIDSDDSEDGCGLDLELDRLPKCIEPRHYELIILTDLQTLTFEGAVQIDIEVKQATDRIVLHADRMLNVDNVWYQDERETHVGVFQVCREQESQLMAITLAKNLSTNSRGQLFFTFSSLLSDDNRGLYKSAYSTKDQHNKPVRRYHAATQFQSVEARRAFPCFDEPAFKATFNLTLIHELNRTALANTEIIYEENIGESQKLVRFAQTPPMSTYLLAFVVGELDYVERKLTATGAGSGSNLTIRAFTPLNHREQGEFALDIAVRAIEPLQDYFGIEFPLNKIDLVPLPDFEAGAMENWGLITFAETQMLVDQANTSPDSKSFIASTVVHELGHQWFGNLVTMDWWNDLWLNEGFATWVEYNMTAELIPDLDFPYLYLLNSHIHALDEDSFRSAHPIQPAESNLNETQDIDDLFDAISYNKAAAIIRILHDVYLKPPIFKDSIQHYLKTNAYGNTKTEDLWRSMELKSGLPVGEFMDSWIKQPGHPLIRVNVSSNGKELLLEQERFLIGAKKLTVDELQQRWMIPVTVLVSDGNSKEQVLELVMKKEDNITRVALPNWFQLSNQTDHWLKLNANFSGFYRVQYARELLELLRKPVEKRQMSPMDRLNLVDEVHSLTQAGKIESVQLAKLLTWLENEPNGAVVESAVGAFASLLQNFQHHKDFKQKLELFGRNLFSSLYKDKFNLSNNCSSSNRPKSTSCKHIFERGRAALLSNLVQIEFEPAIEDALRLFESSATAIEPSLRAAIYKAVSRAGSKAQFERLFQLFEATNSREERQRLAHSIGKTNKLDQLERAWLWLNKKGLQLDDKFEVVNSMLLDGVGVQFVKRLLETELESLVKLNDGRSITDLIEQLCISLGPNHLNQTDGFFSRHKSVNDWQSSRNYIERMLDWQSHIQERDSATLESFVNSYLESRKNLQPPPGEARQRRHWLSSLTSSGFF